MAPRISREHGSREDTTEASLDNSLTNARSPVPALRDSVRVARKRRALAVLIADQSLETLQKCRERFRRNDEFRFDAVDLIGAWAGCGDSHASGKLSRASGSDHLHPYALFTFLQAAEKERRVACVRSNALRFADKTLDIASRDREVGAPGEAATRHTRVKADELGVVHESLTESKRAVGRGGHVKRPIEQSWRRISTVRDATQYLAGIALDGAPVVRSSFSVS